MNGVAKLLFLMTWNLDYIFRIQLAAKLVTDICSQSLEKMLCPKKTELSKINLKKKIHLFRQKKNLKQNYNFNIPYFRWVHRGEMGLQILLNTLFDAIRWFWNIASQKRSIFDQISKISKVWEAISSFKQKAFNNALNKNWTPAPPLNNIQK